MNFPRPVGCDYDHGPDLGLDRSDLWNCYLILREQLQQISLEFFIGPVQFINEQKTRHVAFGLYGLQQRALYQKVTAEDFPRCQLPVNHP